MEKRETQIYIQTISCSVNSNLYSGTNEWDGILMRTVF
jgi:hypothetical protein